MSDEQSELQRLRQEVRELQERVARIGYRLDQMEGEAPTEPPLVVPPLKDATRTEASPPSIAPPVIPSPAVFAKPPPLPSSRPPVFPPAPRESFEVRLGTYWLPRIGIAVLLTGMVFFAAYITPRLTVPLKVALGYFTCLVLGVLGLWLEKKTPQFARILQAGSLALAYFVTYAAHFVDAFRVIHSPALAIAMLSVVVLFIVGVAQERQSPTLGGMALFFGYYTSVVSGVATFTLASNAVLALAAIFFLARNRWVHISYGAVLATYLTYMIWVWKLSQWGHIDHLVFDSGYLSAEDFRLRAAFLSLYWLVFAVGGLIVHRDAMNSTERNGLLTLNNVFFFMLFSLLMHHAYPDRQWALQFSFGGALLIVSALAYQRFAPDRSVMDALFLQGVAVATLGLVSYLKGAQLIAAMALESAFLLVLARWMGSRGIAWIGRAAFTVAAVYAWDRYDDWDAPMRYGVWFAAAVGFVCARLENRAAPQGLAGEGSVSRFYFAMLATALAMSASQQEFGRDALPWAWILGAVVVAVVGGALRTREIAWAAHLPLAWAHGAFYVARFDGREWTLAPTLALIAVTFGFGITVWATARARQDEHKASLLLWVYGLFAVIAVILATFDHCPERWLLAVCAGETLVLVVAAVLANERTFLWLGVAPMVAGAVSYLDAGSAVFRPRGLAWVNLLLGSVMLIVAERTAQRLEAAKKLRPWFIVAVTALTIFALRKLVSGPLVTVSWAGLGFVLLTIGFTIKQRSYRLAGLTAVGFSLLRAVFRDLAGVETIYRILSFIGLGVILLVLAFLYAKNREKLAKWL